jgi:hypothetical protein
VSLFEFLTVAVSIVLALGLVRLIHGLRLASGNSSRYWIHLGYVVMFIVNHLLFWWALWGFQTGVDWNFGRFLYVFIGPMLLYSLASTLIPDDASSVTCWRDYFYRIHRGLFLVWAGLVLHQALAPILIQNVLPWPAMRLVFGVAFAGSFVGAFSKSPLVHSTLFVAVSVGVLSAIVISFAPIVR